MANVIKDSISGDEQLVVRNELSDGSAIVGDFDEYLSLRQSGQEAAFTGYYSLDDARALRDMIDRGIQRIERGQRVAKAAA